MRQFRGHLYNWYDLDDLRVLEPAYVSTVDSGNLAGHLIALRQACLAIPDDPVFDARTWQALDTALALAHERLSAPASPGEADGAAAAWREAKARLRGARAALTRARGGSGAEAARFANAFASQFVASRTDARVAALATAIGTVERALAQAPKKGAQHDALASQLTQLQTASALASPDAQLVDKASAPSKPAAPHLVRDGVELEVVEAQHVALVLPAAAAQQRLEAGEQLLEREGLGQVVVGAGLEARDAVVDRVASGEHQHRRAVAGVAQAAADLEAVEPGHQHIQEHGVGGRGRLAADGLPPVVGQRDLVALDAQDPLERLPDRRLVVDHQHAHRGKHAGRRT
jgi:hypothetical protein